MSRDKEHERRMQEIERRDKARIATAEQAKREAAFLEQQKLPITDRVMKPRDITTR